MSHKKLLKLNVLLTYRDSEFADNNGRIKVKILLQACEEERSEWDVKKGKEKKMST